MEDSRNISIASRIRGSLYGVAVADALGGPVEFHRRGTFPLVTGFRPNDNFDLPSGTWTDDTSMMLCLAQSLVDTKGVFIAQDQVQKYIQWFNQGYMSSVGHCFDIGNATRIALRIWKDVFDSRLSVDCTDSNGHSRGQDLIDRTLKREIQCGNGSLMRVASIPLIYHRNPALALQNAHLSSQVTHPYPTNTEACQIYTHLVTLALSPMTSKADLAQALTTYPFTCTPLRARFAKYTDLASFALVPEAQIQSSGFVVATLEAALWSFFTTSGFREGGLKAVNLGDDADTVGAVYGGLAGAFYGVEDVPVEWMEGLMRRDLLDEVVEGVVKLVESGAEEPYS